MGVRYFYLGPFWKGAPESLVERKNDAAKLHVESGENRCPFQSFCERRAILSPTIFRFRVDLS